MLDPDHEVTFRFLARPADVNFGGKVHGGATMAWFDQAGYACATRWSSTYCVTASVSGLEFLAPILIGELVTVRARLVHTDNCSMYLLVDVLASDLHSGRQRLTTSGMMVFVALDGPDGEPTPVPAWQPRTKEDTHLQACAMRLLKLSRAMEEQAALIREKSVAAAPDSP